MIGPPPSLHSAAVGAVRAEKLHVASRFLPGSGIGHGEFQLQQYLLYPSPLYRPGHSPSRLLRTVPDTELACIRSFTEDHAVTGKVS